MKAKELIYNLKKNFEGVNSEIAKANDHHLMWMLDEARATLAARKMDARVNVELMTQFVDLAVQDAGRSDFGDIGDADVKKVIIPNPINYNNGAGIFTVGPADGASSFSRITFSQIRTALSRKYTGSAPKWFLQDNEIYIINIDYDSSQKVRVRGVFEEPWRVQVAKGDWKAITPWDFDYPLSTKDVKTVYQLALTGDMGWGDAAAGAVMKQQEAQKNNEQVLQALQNLGNAQVQ